MHQHQRPPFNRMRARWLQFFFLLFAFGSALSLGFAVSCGAWKLLLKNKSWTAATSKTKIHFPFRRNDKLHVWVMISRTIWHIIRQCSAQSLLAHSSTRMNEWICSRHSMSAIHFLFRFFFASTCHEAKACYGVAVRHFQFEQFHCFAFLWIPIHLHHDYGLIYFSGANTVRIRANRIPSSNCSGRTARPDGKTIFISV